MTVVLKQASNKICKGIYINKEKLKNILNLMNICTVLGIDSYCHISPLYVGQVFLSKIFSDIVTHSFPCMDDIKSVKA